MHNLVQYFIYVVMYSPLSTRGVCVCACVCGSVYVGMCTCMHAYKHGIQNHCVPVNHYCYMYVAIVCTLTIILLLLLLITECSLHWYQKGTVVIKDDVPNFGMINEIVVTPHFSLCLLLSTIMHIRKH